MGSRHLYGTTLRAACIALVCCALAACASENSVNRFLSNASDKINSIDSQIAGSQVSAAGCRPAPNAPAITDPARLFAGRTFTYRRGQRHKGKVTYDQGGSFTWENEDGTRSGSGNWSTKGAKWCESFNASAHNEALSSRCWPVISAGAALCFGITRLVPDHSALPPG